jgi:hypothetical protein
MRRITDQDEGAVTIIVALSLIVLFGMGALVLDVGNLYWERRQLQNGAEAGALAAAQDYVDGAGAGAAEASARTYASANNERDAFVENIFQPTANSVTVETITGNTGSAGVLDAYLAGVIGTEDYFARASATASWGGISSASTIPLTFSFCEWKVFTGLDAGASASEIAAALPTPTRVIYHHTSSASDVNDCDGPAGQDSPGGFGWLDEQNPCEAFVENGEVNADTGASMSKDCKDTFSTLEGKTVLMPIFVEVTGPGTGAMYDIGGFAAFEFEGYRFPGVSSSPKPCSSPLTCISGRFVNYYDLAAVPDASAPDFGAYTIGLTG